jgi:ubiquinone/menaquinone biosynthesis C-methylase UbiE
MILVIPSRSVFDKYAGDYDQWFDDNPIVYQAELRMLCGAVPGQGKGLEVGIGSGRFAAPLGIRHGIDPSPVLARMAKRRGIDVVLGEGEHLPYRTSSFNYVLMMTVICFLNGVPAAFNEAHRVIIPGGTLIAGFIEKDGETAGKYRHEKTKGRFLRFARFRTVEEVTRFFESAGFANVSVIRRARGFCVITGQKR